MAIGSCCGRATLSVQERVSSIVVMVPVSYERHYTLKRVGD
jgi:hypothetical protein